jgi:hypothetical protein
MKRCSHNFCMNAAPAGDIYCGEHRAELGPIPTIALPLPPQSGAAQPLLPTKSSARKEVPIASGVLDYFPAALAEIARISFRGNQQHNPGQPLHWARGKSMDQADTIIRHFLERGKMDSDGMRHSAKLAWRALALLQLELEAEGAPIARGARLPEDKND